MLSTETKNAIVENIAGSDEFYFNVASHGENVYDKIFSDWRGQASVIDHAIKEVYGWDFDEELPYSDYDAICEAVSARAKEIGRENAHIYVCDVILTR